MFLVILFISTEIINKMRYVNYNFKFFYQYYGVLKLYYNLSWRMPSARGDVRYRLQEVTIDNNIFKICVLW